MKKILFSIFFAFAISALFSQNYFNTTTSSSGSNLDVSHLGTLTLGTTFEILNDPWRAGEGRLIELFKNSGNVSMMLGNSSGKFAFNVAGNNGAFFPDASTGDIVLRKFSGRDNLGNLSGNKVFFSLNNAANDGNHAFIFGDNLNKNTLTVLNNGKIGINTSSVGTSFAPSPNLKLQINGDMTVESNHIISLDQNYYVHAYMQYDNSLSKARFKHSGYYGHRFDDNGGTRMVINQGGNVGIGTITPDEKLTVKGKIHAEEVRVDLNVPPDFVFQKYYTGKSSLKRDYKMLTLEEVEVFTKKNHHLPEIPSAKEIKKEGLNLKQMTTLLLQKVEELTLYTIEQEKRIKKLEQKLKETKK